LRCQLMTIQTKDSHIVRFKGKHRINVNFEKMVNMSTPIFSPASFTSLPTLRPDSPGEPSQPPRAHLLRTYFYVAAHACFMARNRDDGKTVLDQYLSYRKGVSLLTICAFLF
jgi:hypothetical protein